MMGNLEKLKLYETEIKEGKYLVNNALADVNKARRTIIDYWSKWQQKFNGTFKEERFSGRYNHYRRWLGLQISSSTPPSFYRTNGNPISNTIIKHHLEFLYDTFPELRD